MYWTFHEVIKVEKAFWGEPFHPEEKSICQNGNLKLGTTINLNKGEYHNGERDSKMV